LNVECSWNSPSGLTEAGHSFDEYALIFQEDAALSRDAATTTQKGFIGVALLRQKSRRWHSKLCQKYPIAQIQRGFGNAESPVFSMFFARQHGWHCLS
jgi:hypothetical protein